MIIDVDISRRVVIERGVQARADLQQLTILMADQLVTEAVPNAVLRTAGRAIRARDDALVGMLDDAVAVSTAELWKRMREHQADVDALASECLTLAAGAILRDRGADGGLCAVADHLLAEVTDGLPVDWRALSVPGSEDRTSYRTGVIGLRCSARGFWSLPVALHEMGHVIAQTLDTSGAGQPSHNPVRAVLVEGGSSRQREELFADFFATCAIGPAYGAALVLSRFDPKDARTEIVFEDGRSSTATHPSVDKRIHLVLETLRRMDERAGRFQHPYRTETEALRSAWFWQASSVGVTVEVDRASVIRLDALVSRFWKIGIGPLKPALHGKPIGDSLERYFLEGTPMPPASTTVRDVIGTAWRLRLEGSEPASLEKKALALIKRVVKEA
ncbi:hypothetical protein [Pseudarthrobacter sp. PvP090]|uniref:hypothetical protein n=1 Tax=Pseudarthrobacter sp. PvP090 TaxID=3156393 RepID=UPI003396BEF2